MAKRRPNGDGMIRKRADGRWEGAIVIGHKADGSYLYKWVQARTQKELLPKLHRAIEAYRGVDLTEDSRMTLGEWFERWFKDYAEVTLRPSTVRGYRRYAAQINRSLGEKQIGLITTQQIQRMYNKLKRDGRERAREKFGDGLSDSSVRSIHMLLHEVMEAAVQARLIAKNPTAGTKIPRCNYPDKKILSEGELAVFIEDIEREPLWRDFFYAEITTGPRRGEICGLKWSDLDMEKGALNDWIFPNLLEPGKPMNPSTAYGKLKSILKAAELPDIRFHDLRHTFATHALTSGVDAKTLAGILGHTNASFTLDTYTHVTGEMQKNAAEIVGGFMDDFLGGEFE